MPFTRIGETTGYVVNSTKVTDNPTTWKEFWNLTNTKYQGRTMVHDDQLVTIGTALRFYGYSFSSNDERSWQRRRSCCSIPSQTCR